MTAHQEAADKCSRGLAEVPGLAIENALQGAYGLVVQQDCQEVPESNRKLDKFVATAPDK
jgi:hypothetical protein